MPDELGRHRGPTPRRLHEERPALLALFEIGGNGIPRPAAEANG
jgi:hypothetical protein